MGNGRAPASRGIPSYFIESLRSFRRPALCHRGRLLERSRARRRWWAAVVFQRRCGRTHGEEA
eukprot:3119143-Pyramimonas_sp.AAC.1